MPLQAGIGGESVCSSQCGRQLRRLPFMGMTSHPSLAAVLAADIAGYSRLMGEDAMQTLAALRRLRAELFGPAVAGNRGKLVKAWAMAGS
ncbi:MAG: class 3 adenylate cyclase [Paracoccaceae bacterium]